MNDKKDEIKTFEDEDEKSEATADKTVFTQLNAECPIDEKAYILFMSGALQGKLFCLEDEETTVGRADDATITIHDQRISRYHFLVRLEGSKAVIEDAGSTNGTFVNGRKVQRHVLENGDQIQISTSTVAKFGYGAEGERMFLSEFYHMANFDAVTGAYNKHAFEKRMEEEVALARRMKQPLGFLMLDIDFFKKVNDTYSHLAGDMVLSEIAKLIIHTIREGDILARYGGEEFAILLRGVHEDGAQRLAERIRRNIAGAIFQYEENKIPVTVSLGVAELTDKMKDVSKLIAIADKCLYFSKENGRNKVTTVSELKKSKSSK